MKTFAYTAFTPEGQRRQGLILAEDETDASTRIAAQGLLPATLSPAKAPARARRQRRIDRDLLAVFTRQMAALMAAGLPADAALSAVQTAAGAPRIERLAAEARAALSEGEAMAAALGRAGGALPAWYAAAVRAGETSGDLAAVFATLADHLETSAGDQAAITSALIYPAFVTLVALVVCAILMTTVAPQITGMFEQSGRPLPPLTLAVMALVEALKTGWPLLLAALALAIAGWRWVSRTPSLRARRDALALRLPLIGRFLRMAAAAQYLRTLALAVNARLPLIEALTHAGGVLGIAAHRADADAAGEALRRGETLSNALTGLDFLNPVARQLVQAGEVSARLGPMCERAAVLAETALRTERKRLAVIVEPAAMVVVGALVLVIVLAVLLPIFDMQALVSP